jgi:hypothetical protein
MPIKIRPIRICGDVAYVTLTRGYEAIIDAADVPLVDGQNWSATVRPFTVYAVGKERIGTKRRTVYLHRLMLCEPDGLQIDHKDGDGLNNRRYNLRVATPLQNSCNQRIHPNNTSGFKGVTWDRKRGKWRAQISINCKQKNLGCFYSLEEAHSVYCLASKKYHAEFGRTE